MGREEDLKVNLEYGKKMKELVETDGWNEIMKPTLEQERKQALNKLCDAEEIDREYHKQQGKMELIRDLYDLTEFTLYQGEKAQKEINENMKEG